MVDKKHTKFQIAIIAIIILIIPVIIVFQLTKPDIVLNIEEDFKDQCFLGQTECMYISNLGVIDFRETEQTWQIIGDNVWCIKTERSVAVPVSDPVGEITLETEVSCNNIAIFDKAEWDLAIQSAILIDGGERETFILTLKGQ